MQQVQRLETNVDRTERENEAALIAEIMQENTAVMPSISSLSSGFASHGAEVHCFAHTLQLAVIQAINSSSEYVELHLLLIRTVAKQLRLHSICAVLALSNIQIKKPSKECVTRWSSFYLMVISNFNLLFASLFFEFESYTSLNL